MTGRAQRLKHLLGLQEQLKAAHEMRRATHLAQAAAVERDIADLMGRDGDTSMAMLFPDVYARYIERARARADESRALARAEADKLAAETVRANAVDRAWRQALRHEERQQEEREALEAVERQLPRE